ncbi:rhomboid family intramembrane serine protease [Pontibacter ummariensis]|nr:rhomboid family intramembrane serine protease [Pontibacter ummariensis]
MENKYAAVVAEKEDGQLIEILQEYGKYEEEAILAVVDEAQKRGLPVPDLEQLRSEVTQRLEEQPVPAAEEAAEPLSFFEKVKGFLQVFVPQPHYYVTPILLNINLAVFLVMVMAGVNPLSPEVGSLIVLGANFGPLTLSGEWWRLLTCTFLHGGILHLLFNTLALVSIGRQLEPLVGRVPFLIVYVLCGLAGSLASLWWESTRVGVGASGAIFGMFGMLLVVLLLERRMSWQEKKAMLLNMAFIIAMNLGYGMQEGIDNAAHSGGLLAGAVLGAVLMFRSRRQITQSYSVVGNALMAGAGVVFLLLFYMQIPLTGEARFAYVLDQVGQKEEQAMQVMQALAKEGEQAKATDFEQPLAQGIVLWEESEQLLEGIDDVEGEQRDKVSVLLDYVRLRKKSFEMLRDDLLHERPLLNPEQQQLLQAINYYLQGLRNGKASEIARQNEAREGGGLEQGADSSSENASGQPLYVVDGVKVGHGDKANMPEELLTLSPDDIESMEVLQEPQAVAAFGADGANGAVLITTKKDR